MSSSIDPTTPANYQENAGHEFNLKASEIGIKCNYMQTIEHIENQVTKAN